MSLFDKVKNMAAEAIEDKKEELELKQKQKKEYKEIQNQLKKEFVATKRLGDVIIDEVHQLVKFKNASPDIKNKSMGAFSKTTLALMTSGASLAIEYALKPSDVIFRFDQIIDYDLYENNETITSGGLGRAVAGGILFGGVGAIVGGVTGKRKEKNTVNNLHLHITTSEIAFPSIMIPYLNKEVKVKSNDYTKALSRAKETISCLNAILKTQEK